MAGLCIWEIIWMMFCLNSHANFFLLLVESVCLVNECVMHSILDLAHESVKQ